MPTCSRHRGRAAGHRRFPPWATSGQEAGSAGPLAGRLRLPAYLARYDETQVKAVQANRKMALPDPAPSGIVRPVPPLQVRDTYSESTYLPRPRTREASPQLSARFRPSSGVDLIPRRGTAPPGLPTRVHQAPQALPCPINRDNSLSPGEPMDSGDITTLEVLNHRGHFTSTIPKRYAHPRGWWPDGKGRVWHRSQRNMPSQAKFPAPAERVQ